YENGTPFTFHQIEFGDPDSAAAFAALWPIGKMPVLEDAGEPIVESSIIIEHLMLHHPGPVRLLPEDPAAALEARRLDRIFDRYVMTPMQKVVFDRLRAADGKDPQGVADARALLEKSYGWLERTLARRTWAAGDAFSLADCAAAPSLYYADKVQPMSGRFTGLAAYMERLAARPSFARVLKEAEPYRHLFPQGD
ncbi:MAG: glutathione S-transferase family protein, partial [Allosphingosinicella sp.]